MWSDKRALCFKGAVCVYREGLDWELDHVDPLSYCVLSACIISFTNKFRVVKIQLYSICVLVCPVKHFEKDTIEGWSFA